MSFLARMRAWRSVLPRFVSTPFAIALMMAAASLGAFALRPEQKAADERPEVSLESMVPRQFGDWREDDVLRMRVVNPQAQEALDRLYSEVLSRVYVDAHGYRVMLSLAYGSNQRGDLQAHKPELCYPAQGFVLHGNEPDVLRTTHGSLPIRRILAKLGARDEPLLYWYAVGDTAVGGRLQKRLVDLRFGLTGRIPDGMLFRVSSIDADAARAWRAQDRFVNQLLDAVTPESRQRLSGLGTI
ncbi:MAG TPA: EpsI family protein [Burkholderiales bacterium]|nr:EpsI family protein [Burkholderiales bacterium]